MLILFVAILLFMIIGLTAKQTPQLSHNNDDDDDNLLDNMTAKHLQDQIDQLREILSSDGGDRLTVGSRYAGDDRLRYFGEIANNYPITEHVTFVQNIVLAKSAFNGSNNEPGEVDRFSPSLYSDRFAFLGVHSSVNKVNSSFGVLLSATHGFTYLEHGIETFATHDNRHYGFVWVYGLLADHLPALYVCVNLMSNRLKPTAGGETRSIPNPDHSTDEVIKLIERLGNLMRDRRGLVLFGGMFGMPKHEFTQMLGKSSSWFGGAHEFAVSANVGSHRLHKDQYSHDYIVASRPIMRQPKVLFHPYTQHTWLSECELAVPVQTTGNKGFGEVYAVE